MTDFIHIIGYTDDTLQHTLLQDMNDEQLAIQYNTMILNKEDILFKIDGKIMWVLSSHIPIHDQNNVTVGVLSYYKNIHDVKQLSEENEKLKEQYKFLAHQTAEFLENVNKSHEQQYNYRTT